LALRSSPELLVHEHQADAPLIKAMAEALVARAGLPAKKAKLVARLSVEMTTHYLDMWLIEKSMRTSAMIDELKVAVFAYLALYLDKD
jgi:hypothetical protein